MKLKKLPIGQQTFSDLQQEGVLYVDKTEQLYQLVSSGKGRYFLSRPRRFGKSLTCSTLATIFAGRKELFKDLWLGTTDYSWDIHPVVYLDFSGISHGSPDELRQGLHNALDDNAQANNTILSKNLLKEKFAELIKKLAQTHGPVVIIIDEYDKPIIDHIDNPAIAQQMRLILKEMYELFKDAQVDAAVHFLFVTGVSKFSKVSLFSGVNNLNDLTIDDCVATLVGYTDAEVDQYLKDHIQALAAKRGESYQQTRALLQAWYNGYHFSTSGESVYNPFSLHNCLTKKSFNNYWFSSGTPDFLIKMFKKNPDPIKSLIKQSVWGIASSDMEAFELEAYHEKIITLLLQTGYLTIKGYDEYERNFSLDYPNREVRLSMTEQIMELVAKIPKLVLGQFIGRFTRALQADDINAYCTIFSDYLKLIPHDIIVDREKFFQATFYGTALLIDPKAIASEVATDRGYIDVVLHGATKTFLMEFKNNKTPEMAMQQIIDKKYYEKLVIEGKNVTLVGINFSLEKKGVEVSWLIKELPL